MRTALIFGFLLAVAGCGESSSSGGGGGGGTTGTTGSTGTTGTGTTGSTGTTGGTGGSTTTESPADKLYRHLTGQFDSTKQAKSDASYLSINLLTCPIEIPTLGTRILHVEQSVIQNGQIQAPYRQRVYVVSEGADPTTQAVSAVWEFKTPGPFAGFCDGSGKQATPADLVERTGCQVELTWMTDHFEGSTPGKKCLSDFQGATYATSEVKMFADRIESWDRGWDASDKQVWGAVKGGYVFDRLSPLPEPKP